MQGFKHFKPATLFRETNLEKMAEIFKDTVGDSTKTEGLKDADKLTKTYAGALFDNAFGEFEFENDAQARTSFKDKFVELLTTKDEKKTGFFHRKTPEEKSCMANNRFEELVKEINHKTHKASPLNPEAIEF